MLQFNCKRYNVQEIFFVYSFKKYINSKFTKIDIIGRTYNTRKIFELNRMHCLDTQTHIIILLNGA